MLDLTGGNLIAYIRRIIEDAVSRSPRFRDTLGQVTHQYNNIIQWKDATVSIKDVSAAGNRLSPDYFMLKQYGRAILAKVQSKEGQFVEWVQEVDPSRKTPVSGVYYLNVDSVSDQTNDVGLTIHAYRWTEGKISDAQGSVVYLAPDIDGTALSASIAGSPPTPLAAEVGTGDAPSPGTDILLFPHFLYLITPTPVGLELFIGSPPVQLDPMTDYWYQREESQTVIQNTAGGQEIANVVGPFISFTLVEQTEYELQAGRDYIYYTGSAGIIIDEEPDGEVDGSNTAFILDFVPLPLGSLDLYLCNESPPTKTFLTVGVDYTISGRAITMAVAPAVGQYLLANYQVAPAEAWIQLSHWQPPGSTITAKMVVKVNPLLVEGTNPENILDTGMQPNLNESLAANQVFIHTPWGTYTSAVPNADGTITLPQLMMPGEWCRWEVRIDAGQSQATAKKYNLNERVIPGLRVTIGDNVVVDDQVAIIISPTVCETYEVYGSKENLDFTIEVRANDLQTSSDISEMLKQQLLVMRRTNMEADGLTIFEARRAYHGAQRDLSGTAPQFVYTVSITAMADWKVYVPLVTRLVSLEITELAQAPSLPRPQLQPRARAFGITRFLESYS